MEQRQAEIVVVLGPRGSGKSTLVQQFAREHPRRIILDPLGEHAAIGQLIEAEELADVVIKTPSGELAYRVATSDYETGADVADISLGLRVGLLIVDEADQWLPSKDPLEPWQTHVERGRHYRIDLILATRRPYRIWRTATANAAMIYAFRTMEPRDVAYIKDYAGSEAARRLAALSQYCYVGIDCRTGELTEGRTLTPGHCRGEVVSASDSENQEPDTDDSDDTDEQALGD